MIWVVGSDQGGRFIPMRTSATSLQLAALFVRLKEYTFTLSFVTRLKEIFRCSNALLFVEDLIDWWTCLSTFLVSQKQWPAGDMSCDCLIKWKNI